MLRKITQMRISIKLPLIIVLAATACAVGIGYASYTTASDNAIQAVTGRITTILDNRKQALTFYLQSIEQDMRSVAASPFTHKALSDFGAAWAEMGSGQTAALKTAYITDNPNPTGQKEKLDQSSTGSSYDAVHAAYHPWFRTFLRERDYYDIFLFDMDGNLVYSVFKEQDYATNLTTGEYKDTDLGHAYRAARDTNAAGSLHFFDFRPYAPSADAPASFIGMPLFDGAGKRSACWSSRCRSRASTR